MPEKAALPRARLFFFGLALTLAMSLISSACSRKEVHREKATIALATLPEATLANLAQDRGFFSDEGLDTQAHYYPYGKIALQQLLQDKADFATVAETPIIFSIMNGDKISVIATIVTSRNSHVMVGRKDRGIAALGDLRGKTIATTLGTSAQFFLDAMLLAKGISKNDVKIVDLPADKLTDALAHGDVDAISSFAPYTIFAEQKLGTNAILFADKDIYRHTFHVVAKQDFIRNNPEKVSKVLRALIKAERFTHTDPATSEKIVGKVTGLQMGILKQMWSDLEFSVSLDQTLILALEDESDWAIKNGLTKARSVPNYLNYVYLDGLQSVRPESVRILK